MINARIPLPIIAKLVGWSPSTLAKMAARYGHFSIDEMRSAMDLVSSPKTVSEQVPQEVPKVRRGKTKKSP